MPTEFSACICRFKKSLNMNRICVSTTWYWSYLPGIDSSVKKFLNFLQVIRCYCSCKMKYPRNFLKATIKILQKVARNQVCIPTNQIRILV